MKIRPGILALGMALCLLTAGLFPATGAWARPTTPEQARTAVLRWLGLDAVPLGAAMGRQIKAVQTCNYDGAPAYYVVYLEPAGIVFLPADDLVEPIIGFLPSGQYDPSPANPLGALVSRDIPGRVLKVREVEAAAQAQGPQTLAPETPQAKAQRKWDLLTQSTAPKASELAPPDSINDVRVAPLVESRWSQSTVSGENCYNYYTPNNYVCGCVATAMAQLMRFWQYPTDGIGVSSFLVKVDATWTTRTSRGGDGSGGAYDWANMALVPSSGVDETQRQAIGALTYDAGLSVHMSYASGGSATDTLTAADAFTGTFGYANANKGYNAGSNLPETERNAMVNPNLHAGYPVLFGICNRSGSTNYNGHAIVCDGYGYDAGTMYHHLNMGWSGSSDAWYNLPNIGTNYNFNSVYKCVYNVYPTGTGEIIAGRVTNASSSPLSGVTVSASGGYATTTGANGIYALAKVPSGTTFTVTASLAGYSSSSQTVTTGTSGYMNTTTGNQWPIDFTLSVETITLNQALDNTGLSFNCSGSSNWYGQSATWCYGGSAAQSGAIADGQSTQLVTTVTGPGTLSYYWQVSSEANRDFLDFYVDATKTDSISGEASWTKMTKTIPRGIHTITWKYSKDSSASSGSDCGWVDKVVYSQRQGDITPVLQLLLN